jgi:hypothetical protein
MEAQQFPSKTKILTLDDDHTGQNMSHVIFANK